MSRMPIVGVRCKRQEDEYVSQVSVSQRKDCVSGENVHFNLSHRIVSTSSYNHQHNLLPIIIG